MPETTTKERPILFSGDMVRAILDGRKTQTRRVVKQADVSGRERELVYQEGQVWASCLPEEISQTNVEETIYGGYVTSFGGPQAYTPVVVGVGAGRPLVCPYGEPGERLWVRETWAPASEFDPSPETGAIYRADSWYSEGECFVDHPAGNPPRWRPSIHMPRWASRITLEVTGVRVERLQAISHEDCLREGVDGGRWYATEGARRLPAGESNARNRFYDLWDSINAAKHPWNSNPWVWVVAFRLLDGVEHNGTPGGK